MECLYSRQWVVIPGEKGCCAQVAAIGAEKFNQEMVIFPGYHLSFYHAPDEWSSALIQYLQRVKQLNK